MAGSRIDPFFTSPRKHQQTLAVSRAHHAEFGTDPDKNYQSIANRVDDQVHPESTGGKRAMAASTEPRTIVSVGRLIA
jgi:hypothetical protein